MLLNITLKFPRISRPRPVLASSITTTNCTFLSKLQKEKKPTENISFHKNDLHRFVERKVCSFADKTWNLRTFHFIFCCCFGGREGEKGVDKNEKLRNGPKLTLFFWIIFWQVRFKFMCENFFCIILKQSFKKNWNILNFKCIYCI